MTVTINLTVVLVTLIVCVALCYICKMGGDSKKDSKEKEAPQLKPYAQIRGRSDSFNVEQQKEK